ncbi:MAG: magnesium/cobalt transporter CorA [Gemmatimonadota bacterium]
MAGSKRKKGAIQRARRLVRRAAGSGSKKPGAAPGTLVHIGKVREGPVALRAMDFETGRLDEHTLTDAKACADLIARPGVTWIDIDGVHDTELIASLGERFGIHRLVLEDIVHTHQRAKVEAYDGHLFIVLRMLRLDPVTLAVDDEQVSFILGKDYVLSFQEAPGDVFDPVRERLRHGRGLIRGRGPDYLAYALMDAVVDHYFQVVEAISDAADQLEEALLGQPGSDLGARIHHLKREALLMRRAVWPLREALSVLYRDEFTLIAAETRTFLRDVYDHTVQVIDSVETLRDVLTGSMDLFLSLQSNRMNEVMKVLTLVTSIFIPLSFLAGLYGMNFDHMPELHLSWGYPALLGLMVAVVLGMLAFFRHKRWL